MITQRQQTDFSARIQRIEAAHRKAERKSRNARPDKAPRRRALWALVATAIVGGAVVAEPALPPALTNHIASIGNAMPGLDTLAAKIGL